LTKPNRIGAINLDLIDMTDSIAMC